MTPKFAKPRFDYSDMIEKYNKASVGDTLTVRQCDPDGVHNSEQASLCNLLRGKGVKLGTDAQTCVHENTLYVRKLTDKKLG